MKKTNLVRILYMEDDHLLARRVRNHLEQYGYKVTLAYDGANGIVTLEDGHYDILIIDYEMPVYDGLEVIKTLVSRNSLPPTIMVAETVNNQVALEAMKLGAIHYIIKDTHSFYLDLLTQILEQTACREQHTQAREKLLLHTKESEERYQQLVELSTDGIALYAEDKIAFINSAGARLLGANDNSEITGQSLLNFIHPDDKDRVKNRLKTLRLGNPSPWIEERFIRLDGVGITMEVIGVSFIYKNKRPCI